MGFEHHDGDLNIDSFHFWASYPFKLHSTSTCTDANDSEEPVHFLYRNILQQGSTC